MSQKKIFTCQECGYETGIYEGHGFIGQYIEAMSCPPTCVVPFLSV